jgi:hypothetical protein
MGQPTYSAAGNALCSVGTSRRYKRGKGAPQVSTSNFRFVKAKIDRAGKERLA